MTSKSKTAARELFTKTATGAIVAFPTKEEVAKMKDMNISQTIRFLASNGYSTKENLYSAIANYLGKRTQHVRNVLTKPLKKV